MSCKPGDKLLCVDNSETKLVLNKIYIFYSYLFKSTNLIYVKGNSSFAYFQYRFLKVGPIIQYIFDKYGKSI